MSKNKTKGKKEFNFEDYECFFLLFAICLWLLFGAFVIVRETTYPYWRAAGEPSFIVSDNEGHKESGSLVQLHNLHNLDKGEAIVLNFKTTEPVCIIEKTQSGFITKISEGFFTIRFTEDYAPEVVAKSFWQELSPDSEIYYLCWDRSSNR